LVYDRLVSNIYECSGFSFIRFNNSKRMDQEALFRIAEIAGWLLSGIAGVVILLLSVIAYFVKKGHDQVEIRLVDHDNKFDRVHDEIKESNQSTDQKFDKVHEEIKGSNEAIHKIALDIAENMKRRRK